MIQLKEITYDNLKAVVELTNTLSEEQRKVVAPNVNSLAEAWLNYETAWPRAIYDDDTLVGFVMLGIGGYEEEEIDKPAYWLWRFMIAGPYQKQGYGKNALDVIVEKCKADQIKYLYASCHLDHASPYHFYMKYGFIDTNKFEDGEEIIKLKIV
ncbi:MAG TPA: GNAT family N-acetyltransferase [Bacilli bacterium]|nr:GNAT family N-acetyltransferase [Bacilli bacterium]